MCKVIEETHGCNSCLQKEICVNARMLVIIILHVFCVFVITELLQILRKDSEVLSHCILQGFEFRAVLFIAWLSPRMKIFLFCYLTHNKGIRNESMPFIKASMQNERNSFSRNLNPACRFHLLRWRFYGTRT